MCAREGKPDQQEKTVFLYYVTSVQLKQQEYIVSFW